MGKSAFIAFFLVLIQSWAPGEKTMVFLGDSLTAGDGIEKQQTFTYLVGQLIEGASTINQGRSGWATSSYLRRWNEVEQKLPQKADIVFIQLGANDLRVDGYTDQVVKQCATNMKIILDRIRRIYPQAEIILMSSTKIDYTNMSESLVEAGFGKHTNIYLNKIGMKYQQLAIEHHYGFIDLYNEVPLHSTHDGAHLSKKGHQRVARVIIKHLD